MAHITDRFYEKRWGIFNHYLYDELKEMYGEQMDWNACVDSFDTERLAQTLHEMGAGYYFITIMQGSKHLIAPNAVYDTIAGTQPGEACARRDLIEDLYQSLSKYEIDLYLYYTGDGPWMDEVIGPKFGFVHPRKNVSMDFVEKWASVLGFYAEKYKDKVKGYWIDGCYDYFGYNDELLKPYKDAVRKGNPNAIVAYNNSKALRALFEGEEVNGDLLDKGCKYEDFTCGEMNDFILVPNNAFVDGSRSHILVPLGDFADNGGWARSGCKRDHDFISNYVDQVHANGGVVTIDVRVHGDGSLEREQIETLKGI